MLHVFLLGVSTRHRGFIFAQRSRARTAITICRRTNNGKRGDHMKTRRRFLQTPELRCSHDAAANGVAHSNGRRDRSARSSRSPPARRSTSSVASSSEPLSAALGQPIIIDNRGGAGGSIGTAVVAKAEPDGHTILIHASAHSAAPAVYPNAPYDAARDLAAVANFGDRAQRGRDRAVERHQDAEAARRRGEERPDDVRVGGRRQRDPLGRRAAAPERRLRTRCTCRSKAVPRR